MRCVAGCVFRARTSLDLGLWTLGFGLWTVAPGPIHVRRISRKREQEEERAQHILPLGDPGHGLDVQRVERKQRRDDSAAPQGAGHIPEQDVQQEGIRDMEEQVRQVMAGWPQPIELAVEHVRKHRDRMPIARDLAVPDPGKALRAQARLDIRIRRDVIGVVIADEVMASHWPIDHQRA